MENDIQRWIQDAKSKGLSDEEIKSRLVSSGWTAQDIDAFLAGTSTGHSLSSEQSLIRGYEAAIQSRSRYTQLSLTVGYLAGLLYQYAWQEFVFLIIGLIAFFAYIFFASAFIGKRHKSFMLNLDALFKQYGMIDKFRNLFKTIGIVQIFPALFLMFFILNDDLGFVFGIIFYVLGLFFPWLHTFFMKRLISELAQKIKQ